MKLLNRATNPTLPLATLEVTGPYTVTADDVTYWVKLDPQPWGWHTDGYRTGVILSVEQIYASLIEVDGLPEGHDVHIRVVPRPYPAHLWGAALDAANPNPAVPAAFRKHNVDTQHRMRQSTLSESRTMLGVVVAGRKTADRIRAARNGGHLAAAEYDKLQTVTNDVLGVLRRRGFKARAATQRQVEWLMHRSVGLGLPDPIDNYVPVGPLLKDDITTFQDGVDVDPLPVEPGVRRPKYVKVTGYSDRNPTPEGVTADTWYTAVLTFGRMEHLEIPERLLPWVGLSQQLDFPIEWSLRAKLRSGEDAKEDMTKAIKVVDEQVEQYLKHHESPPPELRVVHEAAQRIKHTMQTGKPSDAAAYMGWWRCAVSAPTRVELDARVRAVRNLYSGFAQVLREGGQHALYRSFVPGEPLGTTAHTRRGPLRYLAAAIPNLANRIGDLSGEYLGYTSRITRRAVVWDLFGGIERHERTGLTPVVSGLGGGKSVLGGKLAYFTAISGIQTTILDPAGPLARLCYMPELEAISRHVDLLDSEPGTLSPYSCIPEPRREDSYDNDRATRERIRLREATTDAERAAATAALEAKVGKLHAQAVKRASKMREQLAKDTLWLLLPVESRGDLARAIIGDAVRRNRSGVDPATGEGGRSSYHASLEPVLAFIKADERDTHHHLYNLLADAADTPQGQLFFASGYLADYRAKDALDDPVLVVFTMSGLVPPDESRPEESWGEEERLTVPLINLAAHYTAKRIYLKRQTDPALVVLDEAHFLRRVPAGVALVNELARNSRKRTTRVLLLTQKCEDLYGLAAQGLIREAFGGRMDDPEEARAFLKLINAPDKDEYVQQMLTLSSAAEATGPADEDDEPTPEAANTPREFVMRDAAGNVEVVAIDVAHQEHLFAELRTRRRADGTLAPRHKEQSTALLAGFDAANVADAVAAATDGTEPDPEPGGDPDTQEAA